METYVVTGTYMLPENTTTTVVLYCGPKHLCHNRVFNLYQSFLHDYKEAAQPSELKFLGNGYMKAECKLIVSPGVTRLSVLYQISTSPVERLNV